MWKVSIHQAIVCLGALSALVAPGVWAQGEEEDIQVPMNAAWFEQLDLSTVPNTEPRPVGSGTCKNAACDGTDNDRCFESCGNAPRPEDVYGCPRDHQWALTFDDGPSNYTLELLKILDEQNVKATFCVMGAHAKQYPDVLKKAYAAGHQIASHTYSHPHLMSLTNEQIVGEIKATEEAIENAIGVKPKYIRPPFGEADDRVKGIMKALGYKVLLWNVDPTDYDVYMLPDAPKRIQSAFKKAISGVDTGLNLHEDPGFISLQHDLYKQSIDQVPHVIQSLKNKGYMFMTAAECQGDSQPHTNPAGETPKAEERIMAQGINMKSSSSSKAPSATSKPVSRNGSDTISIVSVPQVISLIGAFVAMTILL